MMVMMMMMMMMMIADRLLHPEEPVRQKHGQGEKQKSIERLCIQNP